MSTAAYTCWMSNSFEQKQKLFYKNFHSVFCPALQEEIFFDSTGLNHLIYKNRRPRPATERHYRLSLLPYVYSVIHNSKQAVLETISTDPLIQTWSLNFKLIKKGMNGQPCSVKVIVIRRKPGGKLYFLSTMCQRKCKDRKKLFGII